MRPPINVHVQVFVGTYVFISLGQMQSEVELLGSGVTLCLCYFVSVFDSKHPTGVEWYHGDLDLPLLNEFLSIFS